jgi:hypothetical protein
VPGSSDRFWILHYTEKLPGSRSPSVTNLARAKRREPPICSAADCSATINAGVPIWLFCLVCGAGRHPTAVHDENRSWERGRLWHLYSAGPYHDAMSAQPAEHPEDPFDPQWILRELPYGERANFLTAYREALEGARDPAGWGHLRRVLRLWSGLVIAANRPGFYEAQEQALTRTGSGMLLEDYIRLRRTQA